MMVCDTRKSIRGLMVLLSLGLFALTMPGCTPMGSGDDGNGNSSDNGNVNGDDGNDNGSGQDVPDNGNDNADAGGNDNDNGGDVPVDNGNDNTNDNDNDNTNDNTNDNDNDNTNDNSNDNDNDNDNDNGNDDPDDDVDSDNDGVADADDQCPGTPANATVDANGCPVTTGGGGGGGGDGTTDADGDGVRDADDLCVDTPAGTQVGADGCPIGDGDNNSCASPAIILDDSATDGTPTFSTAGATTDGPNEPTRCVGGTSLIENDIWYCYTATCTGLATAGLCGSNYDTMLAVYAGCGCPDEDSALFCSDDNCGSTYLTSRLTFPAQEGEQYMIRIGGFEGATGDGFLHVECGQTTGCPADAAGDCTADGGNGSPGCDDAQCCADVCAVDAYCCDVVWDDRCAEEALGVCNGAFSACQNADNACSTANLEEGGCSDQDCCQEVCEEDPICCLDMWDEFCVDAAADCQGNVCGSATGSCFQSRSTGGCGDADCCEAVCDADPVCCDIEWDSECVDLARTLPDVCSN